MSDQQTAQTTTADVNTSADGDTFINDFKQGYVKMKSENGKAADILYLEPIPYIFGTEVVDGKTTSHIVPLLRMPIGLVPADEIRASDDYRPSIKSPDGKTALVISDGHKSVETTLEKLFDDAKGFGGMFLDEDETENGTVSALSLPLPEGLFAEAIQAAMKRHENTNWVFEKPRFVMGLVYREVPMYVATYDHSITQASGESPFGYGKCTQLAEIIMRRYGQMMARTDGHMGKLLEALGGIDALKELLQEKLGEDIGIRNVVVANSLEDLQEKLGAVIAASEDDDEDEATLATAPAGATLH